MELAFARQGLETIMKMFPHQWSLEALAAAIDDLLPLPADALVRGHKRVAKEFVSHMTPPISKVVAVVEQEAAKISDEQSRLRERSWDEEKYAESHAAKQFFAGEVSDQHGKHAIGLILATVSGELTERQQVEAMLQMEKVYPGVGWRSAASSLVSQMRREGRA